MNSTANADLARHLRKLANIGGAIPTDMGLVEANAFESWRTRCLNAIASSVGENDRNYRRFEDQVKERYKSSRDTGIGLLEGLADDVDEGYLRSRDNLIAASVFDDFLDMAEHLVAADHFHAAASLTGAVLEDSLRRLASAFPQAAVGQRDGIDDITKKLVKAQVLSAVTKRRIDVWREVRNAADHGRFEDVRVDDVRDMLKGVQEFVATYLG